MRLVADLHIHSVASGHSYSTITEIAQSAKNKGLELIAITDHGPAMPGGPHPYHFGNMRVLPENIAGVRVLKGVEANIINESGELDLAQVYLRKLDVVLAGFHSDCFPQADERVYTNAVLNAIHNPLVDIIVHPGNPQFPLDYDKVILEAAQQGVALEINNSSLCGSRLGSIPNCNHIAELIAKSGGPVFVGSDAHWCDDVGRFDHALELISRYGIKEERVVNTSLAKIMEYLEARRCARTKRLEDVPEPSRE